MNIIKNGLFRRTRKKYIAIMALIAIIAGFQVNVISAPNTSDRDENNSIVSNSEVRVIYVYEGYEKIVQNSKYILFYNSGTKSIMVENRDTGYLWRSIIDYPEEYGLENSNDLWKKFISSLFAIKYTDLKKNEGFEGKAYSSVDGNIVNVNKTDTGLSLDFDFHKQGINITIEISLQDDGISVYVPADKIEENSNFGLMTIELMPFFGAEGMNVDGYILYPDGCGALMRYDSIAERPQFIKAYKGFVFSPEKVDISEYVNMENEQKYNAMLPVYGIKNGSDAFLAIATKGAEETAIFVSPYGYEVNLNRAGFELYYRHFYNTNLPNINLHGIDTAKRLMGKKADKDIILEDHEVRFIFLDSDNANYSGMANVYREHLIENNALKKVIREEDTVPMMISLFMGTKEERMLFDKYISMTTFKQAKTIVEELINIGIDNLQVNLIGWTKDGYGAYPDSWPPDRKLGKNSEMNELFEYTNTNKVRMFIQSNFIDANASSKGFSRRNDVIIQGNGNPVMDAEKTRFILNPISFNRNIEALITKTPEGKGSAINLEKVGNILYFDYGQNNYSSRADILKKWEETFDMIQESGRTLGVEGGNSYVLGYADHLFNIPMKSSGYHIEDETVPFFQMVVHGFIPYTSEPGNLAYDLEIQKLQWIEHGCVPYFELTYDDTVKLKYTNYNRLFNSQYESWIDKLNEIYKEFNERLEKTWDSNIIEHSRINKNLVKLSYNNGAVVYINYDYKDITYEGYQIKSKDYIVVYGREVY